jgi:hypothetical protein
MNIRRVIWNPNEARPRAGWRIVLQSIGWLAAIVVIQALLGQLVHGLLANANEVSTLAKQLIGATGELLSYLTLVGSLWLAGRFLDRRPTGDFGFRFNRSWWIDFIFGLALGALLMTAVFVFEAAAGWVDISGTFVTRPGGLAFFPGILLPLIVYIMVGLGEEWWSRGYLLTNLAEGFNGGKVGPALAIGLATVVQGVVFALLHANNPNASLVSTVNILLISFLLALGFILTGELAIPIGLHITWNFFQGAVFGFPVSGSGYSVGTFIATRQGGPDLWTGGAFGPEAGLVAVGAVLLGALLILIWVRARHGSIHLSTGIAEFSGMVDRDRQGTPDVGGRIAA